MSPKQPLPPSRVGKKPVTAYVDRDLHKQIRRLGIELDKSNQDIVLEALEAYLKNHQQAIER